MTANQQPLSGEQLLRAVDRLPRAELESFVDQVLALRARRIAPHLSYNESELLLRINRTLPEAALQRYHALIARRRDGTLTVAEHTELLDLTDQEELVNAERVAALAELAGLRQMTLPALMHSLGIRPAEYA